MKRTLVLAAASTMAMVAIPAVAADAIRSYTPAPMAPVPSIDNVYAWSGFYAGVNAGYAWGATRDDDDETLVFEGEEFDSLEGALGGAQIGWNSQADSIVFGLEADLQVSDIMQETDSGNMDVTVEYFGTVRGRVGYALDRFLPYLTGGLAYGQANVQSAALGDDQQTHWGYTAGAGAEYAVTENVSVKAEYLYTDLGEQTYFDGGAESDASVDFHTVRAGLNFRF